MGPPAGAIDRAAPGSARPARPWGGSYDRWPTTPGLVLHDEEGARVTCAFRLARWTDRSTLLWLGRHKGTGRGEGSAGLRYDHMQ